MARIACLVVWVSTFGCDTAPSAPTGHLVDYTLTWETDDVAFDGDTLRVVNNLGYTIEVDQAYLVTFGVKLVPCEDELDITLTQILRWMVGGVAHAGHGGENRDPSAARLPRVESLLAPDTVKHAQRVIGNQRYCQVHYLVGPAGPDTLDLPPTDSLDGMSLSFQGRWHRGDVATAVPFTVTSTKAYGTLTHLYPAGQFQMDAVRQVWDADETSGQVVIERRLSTLFNEIEWPMLSVEEVEAQILRNLIGDTRIGVTLGE